MLTPPHSLHSQRRRPCSHLARLRRGAVAATPSVPPASIAAACIWVSSMSMAASDISCGTLHVLCSASGLSLQYHLSAAGSCVTRRHLSHLSHDTQLLNAASSLTSCTDLARLLTASRPAPLRKRLGRHLVRDAAAAPLLRSVLLIDCPAIEQSLIDPV